MQTAEMDRIDLVVDDLQQPSDLILNDRQREAIRLIRHWYLESHKPYFVLGGFAGTGKTTVIRDALKTLRIGEDEVALCAITAKAARVIQDKTPPYSASTIHSLIYHYRSSKPLETSKKQLAALRKMPSSTDRDAEIEVLKGKIASLIEGLKGKEYRPKTDTEFFEQSNYRLIVADECSMIGQKMFDQLLSYSVKVLFVGDPGQLDPIADKVKEKTLHQLAPIDFLLTEIVRHDNAIVETADLARNQKHIPLTERLLNGFGRVSQDRIGCNALVDADQILCFKHSTRRKLNRKVRSAKGLSSVYPLKGEKLVCRLNNHAYGIARGVTYMLLEDAMPEGDYVCLYLDGIDIPVLAHPAMFEAYGNAELAEDIDKNRVDFKASHPPFDYGYALTVHSAQGSEWDKVLVWDDYTIKKYKPDQYAKWLYTAITRAKECCVIAG